MKEGVGPGEVECSGDGMSNSIEFSESLLDSRTVRALLGGGLGAGGKFRPEYADRTNLLRTLDQLADISSKNFANTIAVILSGSNMSFNHQAFVEYEVARLKALEAIWSQR